MSEKNHICTDVETLSTKSNAVIVTIAAVKFNFSSDDVETFCVNVNPREGIAHGLHVSKETVDWWRVQKPDAVKAWQHSQLGLSDALDMYTEFCGDSKHTKHYSQGINFDFPILESSYAAVGKREPWKYYNLVDIRTICWLGGLDYKNEPRIGDYHNALDDCLTQISWIRKIICGK